MSTDWWWHGSHGDVRYGVRNLVDPIAITVDGVTRGPDRVVGAIVPGRRWGRGAKGEGLRK